MHNHLLFVSFSSDEHSIQEQSFQWFFKWILGDRQFLLNFRACLLESAQKD